MSDDKQLVQPPILPQGKPTVASQPVTGTQTLTVACKIPNGIMFDLYDMIDDFEPLLGGGQRPIKRAEPLGIRVSLRGPARDLQAMRAGEYVENPLAGGYALTVGVPRDQWEKIERDYKDHPALVNKLVFAAKNDMDAISEARDYRSIETGYEAIDPDNPQKKTGIRSVSRAERPSAAA